MKEIIAKTGEVILCDDEDFPLLSRFTWYMIGHVKTGAAYACALICGKKNQRFIPMHQMVMSGIYGCDHIDGNKFNNQKANLRRASQQFNGWNKGKSKRCKHGVPTSQYKGVSYAPLKGKPRWVAMIKHVERGAHKSTGKVLRLGYFDTEVEAAKAYNKKVVELRGEWAWVNPIPAEIAIA